MCWGAQGSIISHFQQRGGLPRPAVTLSSCHVLPASPKEPRAWVISGVARAQITAWKRSQAGDHKGEDRGTWDHLLGASRNITFTSVLYNMSPQTCVSCICHLRGVVQPCPTPLLSSWCLCLFPLPSYAPHPRAPFAYCENPTIELSSHIIHLF